MAIFRPTWSWWRAPTTRAEPKTTTRPVERAVAQPERPILAWRSVVFERGAWRAATPQAEQDAGRKAQNG